MSKTYVFTVSLSAAFGELVTVNYATEDVSAEGGADYTEKSGTISFQPGETSKSIAIIVADHPEDDPISFRVVLSSPVNGVLLSGSEFGVATIYSTTLPRIDISDVTVNYAAAPFVNEISPNSSQVNHFIYIYGENFSGTTAVSFNGQAASSFTVVDDNTIRAKVSGSGTTGPVTVTNANGSGQSPTPLTIVGGTPIAISAFENNKKYYEQTYFGYTGTPTNVFRVRMNNQDAPFFVGGGNDVEVFVPYGSAPTGIVEIFTDQGIMTTEGVYPDNMAGIFTRVYDTPTITTRFPINNRIGADVLFTGRDLLDTTGVTIGGVSALFWVEGNATLRARVPVGAANGNVVITTLGGTATTTLTLTTDPLVTDIRPNVGHVGSVVKLYGKDLLTATGVSFNGTAGTGFSVAAVPGFGDTDGDCVITVTVPNAATSGAVVVQTPTGGRNSPVNFTVQAPVPAGMSLRVSGSDLIDKDGQVVVLRGVNVFGYEGQTIRQNPGDDFPRWGFGYDWEGGQEDPEFDLLAPSGSWKCNAVRIPLNEACWLNLSCVDPGGFARVGDPNGDYKTHLRTKVEQITALGMYVILDLHWSGPSNFSPASQNAMMSVDHSTAFWTSLANYFKDMPNVIFELFNEPFFSQYMADSSQTAHWVAWRDGGPITHYNQSRPLDYTFAAKVAYDWTSLGMQDALNAVRATGATNVVLIGGSDYANDLSRALEFWPVDPLRQSGAVWHAYLYGPASRFGGREICDGILNANIPVVVTEFSDTSAVGDPPSVYAQGFLKWSEKRGVSMLAWSWGYHPGASDLYTLCRDKTFAPGDGIGGVVFDWLNAKTGTHKAVSTPSFETPIDAAAGTYAIIKGSYDNAPPDALQYRIDGHGPYLNPAFKMTVNESEKTFQLNFLVAALGGEHFVQVRDPSNHLFIGATPYFTLGA